jgi:hypothetical protein
MSERGIVVDEARRHRQVTRGRLRILLAQRLQLVARRGVQIARSDVLGQLGSRDAAFRILRGAGCAVRPVIVRPLRRPVTVRLPILLRAVTVGLPILLRAVTIGTTVALRAVTIRLPILLRPVTIRLPILLRAIPIGTTVALRTIAIRLPILLRTVTIRATLTAVVCGTPPIASAVRRLPVIPTTVTRAVIAIGGVAAVTIRAVAPIGVSLVASA